jgi:hypothetical protein
MRCQFPQVIVARPNLNPRIRHPNERLLKIRILQSASPQHRPRTRTVRSVDQHVTARF